MNTDNNIKIVIIKPGTHKRAHVAALLATAMSQIKADGLTVIDVRENAADGTFEILAQQIHEYEISARPGIVLPAPTIKEPSPRRDASEMLRHYNRMQNVKYNMAMRNYKGRKK